MCSQYHSSDLLAEATGTRDEVLTGCSNQVGLLISLPGQTVSPVQLCTWQSYCWAFCLGTAAGRAVGWSTVSQKLSVGFLILQD